ncbi:MAG TPA: TolC family protein [Candidatus Polarisedimenticolia bacterium]|nr:TolC family protein [Candidatus Polarisedimenticolia bacterium]
MNRIRRVILVAVLCASVPFPGLPVLRAQTPPPPGTPPPTTPPGTEPTSAPVATLLEYQSAPVTLSLQDILRSSLEKNINIAVRRYDPQIAESLIETQEAFFEPEINLSAREDENTQPTNTQLGGGAIVTDGNRTFSGTYTDRFLIGSRLDFTVFTNRFKTTSTFTTVNPSYFSQALLTYVQPFLRNFGIAVNKTFITIAQNNERISRSQFRQTVMDTMAAAESAYRDLQFAIMDQQSKEASLKLAQDFLDQTRIKVRVGTLPPIEITQAEAAVADREEGIIIGLDVIRTAEDNVRRLMNVPADSPLWHQPIQPADQPEVLDKVVSEEEAIKTAFARRPDLEQARLDLENRDTDLNYRKNQKKWRLDFIGRYGAQGLAGNFLPLTFSVTDPNAPPGCVPDPGDPTICTFDPVDRSVGNSYTQIKDRDFDTWSAELQLGIPLGNKGAEAAYTQSQYSQEQSKLLIQQVEQNAVIEVRGAVRRLETDLKRFKAAQVNTRLQVEKLNAEQKKYENGMSTAFQVLQFQTDLTEARRRENLAVVGYNKSLVELDRVLGILLDTRNVNIAD